MSILWHVKFLRDAGSDPGCVSFLRVRNNAEISSRCALIC